MIYWQMDDVKGVSIGKGSSYESFTSPAGLPKSDSLVVVVELAMIVEIHP